jgi:hypothetical protein
MEWNNNVNSLNFLKHNNLILLNIIIKILVMDSIILLKDDGCGFCHAFEPVYKDIKIKYKNKYKFESFLISNEKDKNKLKKKYLDVYKRYMNEGVPTAVLKTKKGIGEVIIPQIEMSNDNEINKLSRNFYKNIKKVSKSINSDKYEVFVQNGGDYYKRKYLKYKQKYKMLKLKNINE